MTESDFETGTGALRSLGAIEKMFWMMDQNHPMHFVLIAEVAGFTDVAQWQDGLDDLCRQLPLVWTRIESDGEGEPYFQASQRGSIPLAVFDQTTFDWNAAAAAQMAEPFDTSRPPLLRATLVRGSDRATIILCAHHLIADGLSLTFFLRDLLRSVAGETVVLRQELHNLERLIAWTAPAVPPAQTAGPPSDISVLTPYRRHDDSGPTMERVRVSRAATSALIEKAAQEKCSVHGALCAAFVTAFADHAGFLPDHPVRVVSPIDVRRRLLAGSEHIGLCISGMVIEDVPASPSFWDKARHFSHALAPIKTVEGLSGLVCAAQDAIAQVTCVAEAAELAAQLFAAEILLSNLGITTIPEIYGSLRLESVWGPSVALGFLPEQTIGAVTFAGRLHFLHTSYAPVAGLLAHAVELLERNVGAHAEPHLEIA